MNYWRKYLSFFLLGLLIIGCSDDELPELPSDSDFFPLRKGNYWLYDVQETRYSLSEGEQNFLYQSKLAVTDSFPNLGGGFTYVIQLSRKNEGESSFTYTDTWAVRSEANQIVVEEGGVPFVKLAFPVAAGKTWNGNAFNTVEGDEDCGDGNFTCDLYAISDDAVEFDLNGEMFSDAVEVTQNNNQDLIVEQDIRKEVYVRKVGLATRNVTMLEYCTVGDCIGQQEIEKGVVLTQTLIEYGRE
ncbi:MAG: hypothetical protein R2820_04700 [Cyclobacteriaceae bacterium]